MANKLPPPSVWINSQCCSFGTSVFDSILSSTNNLKDSATTPVLSSDGLHYDRTLVSLQQDSDSRLRLSTEDISNNKCDVWRIPFGRSRSYPPLGSYACPTTIPTTQAATQAILSSQASANSVGNVRRFVQLAVVGLVVSPQQEILITRRPSYMRSFPGAWVFPGGSVDATDESLEAAIAREVWEETGLKLASTPSMGDGDSSSWTIECIWESVFPTIPEPEVPIKRHHLVVYLSVKLSEREMSEVSLKLCEEEVDAAVWLSPENVQAILAKSLTETVDLVSQEDTWVDLLTTKEVQKESLQHLSGIYPRFEDNDSRKQPFGMAQGSLFALQEYTRRHN